MLLPRAETQNLEYVSQIESLKTATELIFPPNTAFGRYRTYFPKESVQHPAKMSTELCEYLVKKYTKEEDTLVDPFGGVGTTVVVASLLGRNAIGVELESHFVKLAQEAIDNIDIQNAKNLNAYVIRRGSAAILQGDSRELGKIISSKVIDGSITSPPYERSLTKAREEFWEKLAQDPTSSRYGRKSHPSIGEPYDKPPKVDSVITSPPYAETLRDPRENKDRKIWRDMQEKYHRKYSEKSMTGSKPYSTNPDNIGNLRYGEVDAVTSPPYEEAMGQESSQSRPIIQEKRLHDFGKRAYAEGIDSGSKGKRAEIDVAITSPPYDSTLGRDRTKEPWYDKDREKKYAGGTVTQQKGYSSGHGDTQIGNLKRESYLQAVFNVYEETFDNLRRGGIACIVVKPFVRNKKIIDLPMETYQLLEKCGFILQDVLKMRLNQLSFWRILQYRKFPYQSQIRHEYVLVMQKPLSVDNFNDT